MLQQTRVNTVIPYYTKFIERFPTLHSLAQAEEDELLAMWSGLGYYRRARLLYQGVRETVEKYGGQVPHDPELRQKLPGVGRYTAGAIGSIALNQPEPIVDGNVARVLARICTIEEPISTSAAQQQLWSMAAKLVEGARPGDFNQALMELGSTVCTKSSPSCSACPVSFACQAFQTSTVEFFPKTLAKTPPKKVNLCAVVALRKASPAQVWLVRSEGSLFGGLWNVPMFEGTGKKAALSALNEVQLHGELDDTPTSRVNHILSHRNLNVRVWLAHNTMGSKANQRRSFTLEDLPSVGISRLTSKILSSIPQIIGLGRFELRKHGA